MGNRLSESVKQLEMQHANMKFALSEIAKIIHYHKPLSDAAKERIERIAITAVQEATQ